MTKLWGNHDIQLAVTTTWNVGRQISDIRIETFERDILARAKTVALANSASEADYFQTVVTWGGNEPFRADFILPGRYISPLMTALSAEFDIALEPLTEKMQFDWRGSPIKFLHLGKPAFPGQNSAFRVDFSLSQGELIQPILDNLTAQAPAMGVNVDLVTIDDFAVHAGRVVGWSSNPSHVTSLLVHFGMPLLDKLDIDKDVMATGHRR